MISNTLDIKKLKEFSNNSWEKNIIPTLEKYIEIPNQSPSYDPDWATNGYTDKAINLLNDWVHAQKIQGLTCEVKRIGKLTPILLMVVEPTLTNAKTVLLYGHMDKQPPLTDQWAEGLHPYKPVIKDGRLYGRGGADDGYSTFASVMAIKALKEQNIPHDRYVIIIEGSEESGSPDLPTYIEQYASVIQVPSLVICLDSGCGNYDQLWLTTSLRGVLNGTLTVHVLDQATHSGNSGIVPSSFRIIRHLFNRIENEVTGEMIKGLQVEIPKERIEEAKQCAQILGDRVYKDYFWHGNTQPVTTDVTQLLLNQTWLPQLATTGQDNLPVLANAGNVMRTKTVLKLSIRLPPTLTEEDACVKLIKETLEKNPPYQCEVKYEKELFAAGWNAPSLQTWLHNAIGEASTNFYGKPQVHFGEGGTIPFMKMLNDKFPEAQFVITGLLGPGSNAHGPNEFLEIEFGKKLLSSIVYILDAHAKNAPHAHKC